MFTQKTVIFARGKHDSIVCGGGRGGGGIIHLKYRPLNITERIPVRGAVVSGYCARAKKPQQHIIGKFTFLFVP